MTTYSDLLRGTLVIDIDMFAEDQDLLLGEDPQTFLKEFFHEDGFTLSEPDLQGKEARYEVTYSGSDDQAEYFFFTLEHCLLEGTEFVYRDRHGGELYRYIVTEPGTWDREHATMVARWPDGKEEEV